MHDQQVREQARTLYTQHGAAYAAQQLDIPERTVRRWALTEGWDYHVAGQSGQKAASQAVRVAWQARRRLMADQLGQASVQLLEAISRELAERKRLNLRDAGILLGIMLDKAELLSTLTGGTDQAMDSEVAAARFREMAAELRQRKAAGDG